MNARIPHIAGRLVAAGLFLASIGPLCAQQDGSWNTNGSGNWSDTALWAGGVPDGGGTARFTNNITGNKSVFNDTPHTVGVLIVGDANNSHSFTNAGPETLTFSNAFNAAGTVLINQLSTSKGDFLAAPLLLANDLVVSNDSANALTISGPVSEGGAARSISNVTSRQVILSGNSSFSGGVFIDRGTVGINSSNGAGLGTITIGNSSLGSNAVLASSSGLTLGITNKLVVAGGGGARTLSVSGFGADDRIVTFSGPVGLNTNLAVSADGNARLRSGMKLAGAISGPGGLVLSFLNTGGSGNTAGYIELSGNNTNYSTPVLIRQGEIRLGHANGFGNGSVLLGDSTTNFNVTLRPSVVLTATNSLLVAPSSDGTGTRTLSDNAGSYAFIWAGPVVLSNTLTVFQQSTGGGITLSGQIDGPNALIIFGNTTKNVTLSHSNGFLGGITHKGGTSSGGLILSDRNAAGQIVPGNPASGSVLFSSTTTTGALLTAGTSVDIGSLANTGSGSHKFVLGANTLTVGGNDASTLFGGVISGAGGKLTKVGSGALTLSGSNTYSGATFISNGALVVNGSIVSGSVAVVSGAALGGSGTIAPVGAAGVAVLGSLLVTNDGIGQLTFDLGGTSSNVTLVSGASLSPELAAPGTGDRVRFLNYMAGDLVLNGNPVNVKDAGALAPGTYTLFSFFSDGGSIPAAHGLTSGLQLGLGLGSFPASKIKYDANGGTTIDLVIAKGGGSLMVIR